MSAERETRASGETCLDNVPSILISRDDDPHRPSLENRVAFQGEGGPNLLGYRNGCRKDATILLWLEEAIRSAPPPATVLDIGCAYGNLILMLNARLGCPREVTMWGVDLDEAAFRYGEAFARCVPGYSNCHYQAADLTQGLPFGEGQFDAVNLADVIEHLPDPNAALSEIRRVLKPGGILVLTTPLRDTVLKRTANLLNRISRGKLYRAYYSGKCTELDKAGKPVMRVRVGHDHISEMTWRELKKACASAGFAIEDAHFHPVMSGSAWFDRHPFLLAGLLFLEAIHDWWKRPAWAHAVSVKLRKPVSGQQTCLT